MANTTKPPAPALSDFRMISQQQPTFNTRDELRFQRIKCSAHRERGFLQDKWSIITNASYSVLIQPVWVCLLHNHLMCDFTVTLPMPKSVTKPLKLTDLLREKVVFK